MFEISAWFIAGALALHIGSVFVVIALAYAQGRNVALWTFAGVVTGPFALLIMWFWRGDEGAPGTSTEVVGDRRNTRDRRHHPTRP
jgi:hypothetical protein